MNIIATFLKDTLHWLQHYKLYRVDTPKRFFIKSLKFEFSVYLTPPPYLNHSVCLPKKSLMLLKWSLRSIKAHKDNEIWLHSCCCETTFKVLIIFEVKWVFFSFWHAKTLTPGMKEEVWRQKIEFQPKVNCFSFFLFFLEF